MNSTNNLPEDDRRRFRRFPASVRVKYRVLDVDDVPKSSAAGKLRDGVTANLSGTGLFLSSNEPPSVGTLVEVSFTMPQNKEAKVIGKVSWNQMGSDPGSGVEIFKTSREDFDEIVSRAKRGEWHGGDD